MRRRDEPPAHGGGRADPAEGLLDELRTLFATDALDGLSEEVLRERMDLARRLEGLASVAMARTVARLSRTGAVRRDGATTLRGWVQAETGRSTQDALRLTRLAADLDTMPNTAAALEAGDITPEGADVLVRTARDGRLGDTDEVDTRLARLARTLPPDQLRSELRRRTQGVDAAAMRRDERRMQAARSASLVVQPDGMTALRAVLAPEAGERVRVALDALDLPDPPDTPEELRRTGHQRRADALDELARRSLAGGGLPQTGGLVPQVSVVVDLATLQRDLGNAPATDEGAEPGRDQPRAVARAPRLDHPDWAGLPPGRTGFGQDLSPQAVRRLLCDASVARVVVVGGAEPLEVGRTTRTWTVAQRRAANVRDRGCRGPYCDRPPAWTQLHHVRWWRDGGATDLANGLSLCSACHALVHDDGWDPALDPATRDVHWTGPDGQTVTARARPG